MDRKREYVRRFCLEYIRRLREILRRNPPKGTPCASCAFSPKTDRWVGFMSTIWHLIQAVTNGQPFYCHRNMPKVNGNYTPDPANMIRCANYEAIKDRPEVKGALKEAALASGPLQD